MHFETCSSGENQQGYWYLFSLTFGIYRFIPEQIIGLRKDQMKLTLSEDSSGLKFTSIKKEHRLL